MSFSGIASMSLEKNPPHVPHRRGSDGRLAQETEDILTLFTLLDEMKAIDRLPTYVASSPANMLSSRLYGGDPYEYCQYSQGSLPARSLKRSDPLLLEKT